MLLAEEETPQDSVFDTTRIGRSSKDGQMLLPPSFSETGGAKVDIVAMRQIPWTIGVAAGTSSRKGELE
jgi:hypothetical protein